MHEAEVTTICGFCGQARDSNACVHGPTLAICGDCVLLAEIALAERDLWPPPSADTPDEQGGECPACAHALEVDRHAPCAAAIATLLGTASENVLQDVWGIAGERAYALRDELAPHMAEIDTETLSYFVSALRGTGHLDKAIVAAPFALRVYDHPQFVRVVRAVADEAAVIIRLRRRLAAGP